MLNTEWREIQPRGEERSPPPPPRLHGTGVQARSAPPLANPPATAPADQPVNQATNDNSTGATISNVSNDNHTVHSSSNVLAGQLSDEELIFLLGGAKAETYQAGDIIQSVGVQIHGLLQVVRGTLQREVDSAPGKPPEVLEMINPGDVLGEDCYLLDTAPASRVICQSERATLVRLSWSWLSYVATANPNISAKFALLLARRASLRLARIFSERQLKVALPSAAEAPKSIEELSTNTAFFTIFRQFVLRRAPKFLSVMEFVYKAYALRREASPTKVRVRMRDLYADHLARNAPYPIIDAAGERSAEDREVIEGAADPELFNQEADPKQGRHVYDAQLSLCLLALQHGCLKEFYRSVHYKYILDLKFKTIKPPTLDEFTVVSTLGKGTYGRVFEVVKRDCGKRYAMKIMDKSLIMEQYGDMWEHVVIMERQILASLATLHHPLLINLCYSLQNISFLVLAMDICYGGDFNRFGVGGADQLDVEQVRFVGLELTSLIAHVQRCHIMHRDIKPANMLLDEGGHVRLIDFGAAKQSLATPPKPPRSREYCGTLPYIAPEVNYAEETDEPYGPACDWFSMGVFLYELAEKAFPYGDQPRYKNLRKEFREPSLLDASGVEVPHFYDLLSGLLDWNAYQRFGGDELGVGHLQEHEYWGGVDWELVDGGHLPSPLLPLVTAEKTRRAREEAEKPRPFFSLTNDDESVRKISQKFDASQSLQRRVERIEEHGPEARGWFGGDDGGESLLKREQEMYVEHWGFVSEHALAQEYVESLDNQ